MKTKELHIVLIIMLYVLIVTSFLYLTGLIVKEGLDKMDYGKFKNMDKAIFLNEHNGVNYYQNIPKIITIYNSNGSFKCISSNKGGLIHDN